MKKKKKKKREKRKKKKNEKKRTNGVCPQKLLQPLAASVQGRDAIVINCASSFRWDKSLFCNCVDLVEPEARLICSE